MPPQPAPGFGVQAILAMALVKVLVCMRGLVCPCMCPTRVACRALGPWFPPRLWLAFSPVLMASLTLAPPPFVVHVRPRAQVHKDNKVVQELPIAASKKVARTLRSKRMLARARAVC